MPNKLLTKSATFCAEHSKIFRISFAAFWFAAFFYISFDYLDRFFRIPLIIIGIPVIFGLADTKIIPFLKGSVLVWSVLLLSIATIIAGYFSPFDELRPFSHLIFGWIVFFFSGFLICIIFPDKALKIFVLALVSGLLLSALWGYLGRWIGFVQEDICLPDGRLMLFTGYPALLGLMSGMTLATQFYFWLHKRILVSKKIDPLLMLGIFALLLLSQTRGGIFACAAVMALAFILASSNPKKTFVATTTVAIIVIAAGLYFANHTSLKNNPSYQRMMVLFSDPLADNSISGRVVIWDVAWESFKERPLTGYGMRMFRYKYQDYLEKNEADLQGKYDFMETNSEHAHNLELGLLIEIGLLGFLPFCAIFATIFSAKNVPAGSDRGCIKLIFLFFILHGCIEYMLSSIAYSNILFGTAGIFLGASFYSNRSKKIT